MSESKVLSFNKEGASDNHRFFPEAQGHEKILAGCKKHRMEMRLLLMSGECAVGEITQFDRWTITLKDANDERRTYYKHAIESFGAI